MRATQKVIVATVVVAFCAAAGAALAIPAHAQSLENPARPSNLAATSTLTTVTLTWDDPGDSTITGYKILSRITATESVLTILVSDTGSAGTSYTVRGLEPDATYQFAVLAVNNAGNSAPSQIVTVSTRAQTAPPSDTAALASIIESLTGIIEGLSLKITALEAEIMDLRGTLGGRIVAPVTDSGDFVPVYYAATSHHNLIQKSHYEDRLFLENLTGRLTQTLALPYDVYLTMDECGEPEAVYYPYYARIVLCYEFVTFLEGRLAPYYGTNAELSRGVSDLVTWVMLSELGRALIDVYDLPVTGNEEDAVDQFATVIALEYIPPDRAGNVLSSTLRAWSLGQNDVSIPEPHPVGSDPLASNRLHKVACWIYGSDVHAFSNFVDSGLLTEARAGQCPSEYERMSESWYRLASQFLIKGDPVIKLNGASEVGLNVGDPYTEAGATCTDAKADTLEVARTSDAPDTTRAGTYQLEYSCTDAAGNTATTTRTVVVIGITDDNPPTLDINPRTVTITAGVTYDVLTGVTCTDDQVTSIAPTIISNPFDHTTPGTYTITYSCDDGTNPAVTGTRTITVEQHPTRASIAFSVDVGEWSDGNIELTIDGIATAVLGDIVLTTTLPGEMAPVTITQGSGGSIDHTIILNDISIKGPYEVKLASASDSTVSATRSVTIPNILILDNVVRIGSTWIGDGTTEDPYRFPLRVTGSVGTSDGQIVALVAPSIDFRQNLEVGEDGRISTMANLTSTSASGNTEFVLTASSLSNAVESNGVSTTIPALFNIQIERGEWTEGTLTLTITGSNDTAITQTDADLIYKVDPDATAYTSIDVTDFVANTTGIFGTVALTDLATSGETIDFQLALPDENGITLPKTSVGIPPVLTLTSVSTQGTWSDSSLTLRVVGTESVSGNDVYLDAPGVEGFAPVAVAGVGGTIGTTVSITDVRLSGNVDFRLASGNDGTGAVTQNVTVNIPTAMTLTSVVVDDTWDAGSLTLNVTGSELISGTTVYLDAPAVDPFTPLEVTTGANGAIDNAQVELTTTHLSGNVDFRLASASDGTGLTTRNVTVNIPPALTLTSVSPGPWSSDGTSIPLTIAGTDLLGAAAINLALPDIATVTPVEVTSTTTNIFATVSLAVPAEADVSGLVKFQLQSGSGATMVTSQNVTITLPARPSTNSVDMTTTPIFFSSSGFPPITRAVINDISEIPAVHAVQVMQSYQTLTTLTRSVVNP